jgi:CSLREA domain-containing protein
MALVVCVVAALLVIDAPVARADHFVDIPSSHPFHDDIAWLVDEGITTGYPDGTYRPGAVVTRAAMAAFLYRFDGSPAFTPPAVATFPDVPPSHPFFLEVEWAAATGITTGFDDGTFRPNESVTRQSMSAFLHRVAGEPAFTPPTSPSFSDVPLVHPFFLEVEWMAANDTTTGFEDGSFRPGGPVTRQAMAAFLHRIHLVVHPPTTTTTSSTTTSTSLPPSDFHVNHAGDTHDVVPGDGVCLDAAGYCTLRAAIDETNELAGSQVVTMDAELTIELASGAKDDTNVAGDLDVLDELTIWGNGSTVAGPAGGPDWVFGVFDATLRLERLTVSNGTWGVSIEGRLELVESTVTGMSGIALFVGHAATLEVLRSTVSHNDGGAIFNQGHVVVDSSTIAHNRSNDHGVVVYSYSEEASAEIRSSTLAQNVGEESIAHGTQPHDGLTTVSNTVIETREGVSCSESVISLGHNLDDDGTCGFTHASDLASGRAALGPLGLHGGPTETMVPYGNSPLLDAGADCPTIDQRLLPRPDAPTSCDVGAVEGSSSVPIPLALTVNAATDTRDASPGDGVCEDEANLCTLRAAIDEANAWPAADHISIASGIDPTVAVAGDHEDLNATGDYDIVDWLTITGEGAVIEGSGLDRVLDVLNGGLHLEGVTVTGGVITYEDGLPRATRDGTGGGVRGLGAIVTLHDATVSGNAGACTCGYGNVPEGGGLWVAGTLEVVQSNVVDNEAAQGGGVAIGDGVLHIENSLIADNRALLSVSGGIHGTYARGTIVDSTIEGNVADTRGGGMWWHGNYEPWPLEDGQLTIEGTTFAGNAAGKDGGAMHIATGRTLIVDSTISGNTSAEQGALRVLPEEGVTIRHSTIADNDSPWALYGWENQVRPFQIEASIIQHDGHACSRVTSLGYNIASDDTCGPDDTTDLTGVSGILEPLADNGGPTWTHLIKALSVAIDAIPLGVAGLCDSSDGFDQRGLPRPAAPSTSCDIGAVELQE